MYARASAITPPPTMNFGLTAVRPGPVADAWRAPAAPVRGGWRDAAWPDALAGGAFSNSRRAPARRSRRRRGQSPSCRASGHRLLLPAQNTGAPHDEVEVEKREGGH